MVWERIESTWSTWCACEAFVETLSEAQPEGGRIVLSLERPGRTWMDPLEADCQREVTWSVCLLYSPEWRGYNEHFVFEEPIFWPLFEEIPKLYLFVLFTELKPSFNLAWWLIPQFAALPTLQPVTVCVFVSLCLCVSGRSKCIISWVCRFILVFVSVCVCQDRVYV